MSMNNPAQLSEAKNPIRTSLAHALTDLQSIALIAAWQFAVPLLLLGAGLMLVQPCAATPFQWQYTGSLNTARDTHTATLLFDGRVLVAGGDSHGVYLASAELYDPATGTWTVTGSLNTAREDHTATLLSDGRVLVVGGYNTGLSLASAELYDPATETWTVTGSLNTGRYLHTATLLANGKVLVAGGFGNAGGWLASAELYDPATGNWTVTGSLNTSRGDHTTTLLADGRVLVAGGYNGGLYLADAEFYDPATENWTVTGSLNTARIGHTATLLPDGKVLVAGGIGNDLVRLASAELYDPATGTWTYTGSLNTAREDHTATLLTNGEVLVAAGFQAGFDLASAELYDPGIEDTQVKGRGSIDNQGNEVTFKFRARQGGDGSLGYFSFCDPAAGVCITNAKIRSLSITGNSAQFSGQGHLENGSRVRFNVNVTDNGEPGTSDTISISLSDGYSVSGTLRRGDIRI